MGCMAEIVTWRTRLFAPDRATLERIVGSLAHRGAAGVLTVTPLGVDTAVSPRCRPPSRAGGFRHTATRTPPMTTHELPEEPVFAFTPAYELPDQPQQIRIVFEGMDGYVPTASGCAHARRCRAALRPPQPPPRSRPRGLEQAGRPVHGHGFQRRDAALRIRSCRTRAPAHGPRGKRKRIEPTWTPRARQPPQRHPLA